MAAVRLNAKQRWTVRNAVMRVNLWEGAVRSGKTVASIVAWIKFIREAPAGNLLMVGKTERTLKRNIINEMVKILGRKRCRYVAGAGELWVCGRLIEVVGANDERAEEKIRGMTLIGAYCDEATLYPESFWSMLMSRLSEFGARCFATTNPGTPTHWLKAFVDRAALRLTRDGSVWDHTDELPDEDADTDLSDDENGVLDMAVFSFKLEDNTSLPKRYVANLKREYSGLWYRRFIGGEWIAADGAVYPMWDPDRYVLDDFPKGVEIRPIAMGVDWGATHPTAGIHLGLGSDGVLYAYDEWAPRMNLEHGGVTNSELKDSFQRHRVDLVERGIPVPDFTFADPSAKSFRVELARAGVRGVRTAHNDVTNGLMVVGSLFQRDLLRIVRCPKLCAEIGGYVWDPEATKRGKDEVVKEKDDFCDALRYAIYSSRSIWRVLMNIETMEGAAA